MANPSEDLSTSAEPLLLTAARSWLLWCSGSEVTKLLQWEDRASSGKMERCQWFQVET